MFTVVLTALLQTTVTAAPGSYADAWSAAVGEGKPLVVLIGAEWCPACEQMKNSVMPEVANRGALNNVAYAYVNTDRERRLSAKLMSGNLIPQLLIYSKTPDGWRRQQLVGAQSASAVAQLLDAASTPAVANVSQRSGE